MPDFTAQPTLESHGYNETVPGTTWATLATYLGNHPVAMGTTDWQPTIGAGVLQFQLAAGTIYGDGVTDKLTTPWTGSLPAVTTTGQSRWDTIYVVRDFGQNQTRIGYSLGTSATSPLQTPILPANTDLLHHAQVAMVRVDQGKTQLGAVQSAVMCPMNGVVGPSVGIRDLHEGMRWVDSATGIEKIWRGGKWVRTQQPETYWSAYTDTFISGFTLQTGYNLIPVWRANPNHGTITYVPPVTGQKVRLTAGVYVVEPFIAGNNIQFELRLNCTNIATSVQLKSNDPGGSRAGIVPNGGSKRMILTSDSDLTTLVQVSDSTLASTHLYSGGQYLDIYRVSDL